MQLVEIFKGGNARGPNLRFAFSMKSFSDGYSNTLKPDGDKGRTQPKLFAWRKGSHEEFTLDLDLAVGISYGIESADDLRDVVEALCSLAYPEGPQQKTLPVVVVKIGDWFLKRGYIARRQVEFSGPYDAELRPMRAKVTLHIQVEFKGAPPNYSNFKFSLI